MNRLRPVHDKIIVRRLRTEEKVGSIYVPETNREKPTRGQVLAVGPGAVRLNDRGVACVAPMCCEPGDTIVFGKYAGTESDDILILSDADVLAVEEKPVTVTIGDSAGHEQAAARWRNAADALGKVSE